MEFTKNNKLGYVQAAISFAIILISIFLPYSYIEEYVPSIQLYEISHFSIFLMDYIVSRFFVAIFFLLLVVNIFVQSKKSFGWLSLGVAALGFITIIVSHFEYQSGYSIGFYLILLLVMALFVVGLVHAIMSIVNISRSVYEAKPQPVATSLGYENTNTVHYASSNKIEELKVRIAMLKAEREKIDAELESELRKEELKALRAKTEKLEKELMAKELAELKAKLEKYENAASQSSEEK